VRTRNWALVDRCATEILKFERNHADGWFLKGLARKAARDFPRAADAFSRSLKRDAGRFDAAVELASLGPDRMRHAEAASLLDRYVPQLKRAPYYLMVAAETYSRLGLHGRALPLYRAADQLQPGVDRIQAGRAACSVLAGEIEEGRTLYQGLLERNPTHQRNHYELARLARAQDFSHVEQMKKLLADKPAPAERNIFLYYAIGKELEDLDQWTEAFEFYKKGGDAAAKRTRASGYNVAEDIKLIDSIIETCSDDWLAELPGDTPPGKADRSPIFIVGLPRTGTTLTERILASHSRVESADETFFLRIAVKKISGVGGAAPVSPGIIRGAAQRDPSDIARAYLEAIDYRLGDAPLFIDKYPDNFLLLGLAARAFPEARFVLLRRDPMDSCFAMYKQSFFRQAYTLEGLAAYYIAWTRLRRHWERVLGDRLVEVHYERLVTDLDGETRKLLDRLGLDFEPACLAFHENTSPSATASTVQVREPAHTRSVGKWRHWAEQLRELDERLRTAGALDD
jgi:hypothetical protein